MRPKIAVLLSGGVDSSVTLALLAHEKKYNLTAFYLKIWLENVLSYLGKCPWEEDLSYVRAVCEKLDVPLHVISLQKEYHDRVVRYTIDHVQRGLTPNPDIMCNRRIKFGAFIDSLDSSFAYVATGHYASVIRDRDRYLLKQSPDELKDQTYFLSHLTQQQLSRLMFPLGIYTKDQVRSLAHDFDLPTKDRKDSQGICFLGKISFHDFLKHHLGVRKGALIEYETGRSIGTHDGFWYYTHGQRKGIGLSGGPWYVVGKDVKKNHVFVSKNYFSEEKIRNTFFITDCNWFQGYAPDHDQVQLRVKVRHGKEFYRVESFNYDGNVTIDQNDQGIAAGQFAAFYQKNICLGSGIILDTHSSEKGQ